MQIHSFGEANTILATFVPNKRAASGYTLDNMRTLMKALGNPQNQLKIIHVAGTSGKTSTCYYAAALLKQAGLKVGLTVSPHVDEVNERIQIDGQPLDEKQFCRELTEFLEIIKGVPIKPTYFELLVAFAYWEFAKQKVDYAVIEVGLGGLLDGTNVVDRRDKVCIITDIGLDHINVLGNTLPEIAAQKAGIIQSGNEVFCHVQADEIINVFRNRCNEQQANLNVQMPDIMNDVPDFLPLFQKRNFSLAEAVVNFVLKRDRHMQLTERQRNEAAQTLIPARMEVFEYRNKIIILDGSHNAQKLQTLNDSIRAKYIGRSVAAMISFVDGKSFRLEGSMHEIAQLTDNLIITTFHGGQDFPQGPVDPNKLAELARAQGIATIKIVNESLNALEVLLSQPEEILAVTGSFYLIHDVRPTVQTL